MMKRCSLCGSPRRRFSTVSKKEKQSGVKNDDRNKIAQIARSLQYPMNIMDFSAVPYTELRAAKQV